MIGGLIRSTRPRARIDMSDFLRPEDEPSPSPSLALGAGGGNASTNGDGRCQRGEGMASGVRGASLRGGSGEGVLKRRWRTVAGGTFTNTRLWRTWFSRMYLPTIRP